MTVLAPLLAVSKGDASDLVKKEVDEGLSRSSRTCRSCRAMPEVRLRLPLPPDWAVSKNTTASSWCFPKVQVTDAKDAIHALESPSSPGRNK